ncbi:MAG: dipeptide/oligopeptide/nickel ABC transporter permease/ATP-binding protein [Armatimonadetes bacterium]|nr:dipeptide/oligopeptide/nickel ABC transporter permease/ATP-binding protein [Armatimonadota bacterium]
MAVAATVAAPRSRRSASAWRRFLDAILARPTSAIGTVLLLAICAVALAVPMLPLAPPGEFVSDPYQTPSWTYPMGTDNLGRDLMTRVVWGARLGLSVALVSAGISTALGVVLGSIPAYYGGAWDDVFSRIFDIFLLVPAFFLVIVIVSLFGTSVVFVMIVIGLTTWPRSARIMRSQVLTLKPRAFVQAARAAGAGHLAVLFRHIVPNGLPPVVTNGTLLMSTAILTEAGLSFLGLGDANTTSWGRMILEGQRQLSLAPWLSIFPGLTMLVTVWAFNMVGDALNRFLSPQVREGTGRGAGWVVAPPLAGSAATTAAAAAACDGSLPADGDAPALLDVRDLKMYYRLEQGSVRAVDGVSFQVRKGECYGLVGESGCGKTSIGYTLLRLLPANGEILGGSVRFEGEEMLARSEASFRKVRWERMAMIFQSAMNALNPVQRVGDQMTRAYRLHRPDATPAEARARVEALFDLVGIDRGRMSSYPHEMSGGMRQRAIVALSLLLEPTLLIADEPVTALDVLVQDQILAEMEALRKRLGIAMILVSHDMGVMAETCDRVAVVYAGQIVEEADVATIFADARHPYTRALMHSVPDLDRPRERLLSLPGVPFDLRQEPVGCRFSGRCPLVEDKCRREAPPMIPVRPGHLSRCHFALDQRVLTIGASTGEEARA